MTELTSTLPAYTLGEDSLVRFYPFFLRAPEHGQEEWKVGLENSNIAIEISIEGTRAIQELQAGKSLAETASILHQEYGEIIDLVDLVQELAELSLVECIDGYQFAPPERIGQALLQRIPPGAVAWLYSRVTLLIFTAFILMGPLLLILQPALRPGAQDLLWSPSYTLDLLTLLILTPLLLFKHELGHLLAARAKGLPAELTFGSRLFYLVAVSRIGAIWKRSRFERLVIYSAGMANDCITASLCIFMLLAASHGVLFLTPSLAALLRLLIISEYLGVAWEFQIFLKTDVYHIFTEITGRHDLPERASALFRSWRHLGFLHVQRSRHENLSVPYDKLTLGYTLLSLIGIGASCVWLVVYMIPATFIALHGEITLLATSLATKNVPALLDSLAALFMHLICFLLLGWSLVRNRTKRSSGPDRTLHGVKRPHSG